MAILLDTFYLVLVLHFLLLNLLRLCIPHTRQDFCYYNLQVSRGSVEPSIEFFFLTNSLAFLAASLALDALIHFSRIALHRQGPLEEVGVQAVIDMFELADGAGHFSGLFHDAFLP